MVFHIGLIHGFGTVRARGKARPIGPARLNALRAENRELRQTLAARTDENSRLAEKLAAAKTRIEALLKQIPETET